MNDFETNISGSDFDEVKKPFEIIEDKLFRFESWLYDAYINEGNDDLVLEEDDSYITIPFNEDTFSKLFVEYFYADKWFPLISKYTIPSKLIKLDSKTVDYMIKNRKPTKELLDIVNKNDKKFYRLNSLSSKYKGILSFEEAIEHMFTSERILRTIKAQTSPYLFIRDFVDFSNYTEYRCFVKDRSLLGVSFYDTDETKDNYLSEKNKLALISFIKKIISELDIYNDFTVDIAFSEKKIFVIEINTPVYMMAGSGYFSLYDVKYVLDKKHENIIYPIFKGIVSM